MNHDTQADRDHGFRGVPSPQHVPHSVRGAGTDEVGRP
ncbi:hypothetical protein ABH935_009216 [Catenulispora sp. GAS73]